MTPRRRLLLAFAGTLAALCAAPSRAELYPSRPLRVIVPWPPGGNADLLARVVGERLAPALGQAVVIDNHAGAGGNIGMAQAAGAPADGYTLVEVISANAINETLYPKLGFALMRDFVPIGMAATMPLVLVVNPALPVRSVDELVAYARAHPGKLNYASGGSGTGGHLAAELFKSSAGIDIVHVPYKGATPAVTDIIAGQVQIFFDGLPSSLPHIRSGKLRALAVTTPHRASALPDLPTVAEAGLPGFDVRLWLGFMARQGTPAPVVERLNAELNRALAEPETRQRLAAMGLEADPGTPERFGAYVAAEIGKWGEVIRAAEVKVD
jgi:tripartite-type tricarboxylate transporter receptor subunit TctC